MKRRSFLRGAGLGGVAALGGCMGSSNGNGSNSQEVHGLFEANTSQARAFFNQAAQAFTEETGIAVVPEFVGAGTSFDQRIATLLQTGNAPEVAQLDKDLAVEWQNQGLLAPVTQQKENVEEHFGDTFEDIDRVVADGEDYMAPVWTGPLFYTYRRDIFEEAGILSSPPKTYEEELEAWAQVEDVLPDDMGGVASISHNSTLMGELYIDGLRAEGEIDRVVPDGDGGWSVVIDEGQNKERMIAALEYAQSVGEYSVDLQASPGETIQNYYTGQAAIGLYPGARPLRQAYENNMEGVGQHSRIMQKPYLSAAEQPTISCNVEGMAVLADAENTDAGKQFVEFLLTGERYINLLLDTAPLHNVPLLDPIFEDPRYADSDYMQENNVPDEVLETLRSFLPIRRLPGQYGYPPEGLIPFAESLRGEYSQAQMVNNVSVQGADPGQEVDKLASSYRDQVADLTGN